MARITTIKTVTLGGSRGNKMILNAFDLKGKVAIVTGCDTGLGQGMALGWLNVVSNSLCKGELVPATDTVRLLSRRCCLVVPANRAVRPIVENVRDWIIEEMREDMRKIDALYPHLGLAATLQTSH